MSFLRQESNGFKSSFDRHPTRMARPSAWRMASWRHIGRGSRSGQIVATSPRVLGPPKKVAFWTGNSEMGPLISEKSRWWWNIHYNLARCNVRKGHKTWGWLSWAVVSYVSHSCSVWDSHWIPSLGCIKRHQMSSMWIRSFLLFETAIRRFVGDLFLKNSNRIHDPRVDWKEI